MVSPENPQSTLWEQLADIARTVGAYALWPLIKPERSLRQHIAGERKKLEFWANGRGYQLTEAVEKGGQAYAEQHQPLSHRIRRKTVAIIAAAAIGVPGVLYAIQAEKSAPEAPRVVASDLPTFSPNMTHGLDSDFNKIKQYWKTQGVDLSDTSLVILDGQDIYTCGSENVTSEREAIYCTRPANTVVVTAATMNSFESTMGEDASRHFVLGHEMGHAAQNRLQNDMLQPPAYELQATCYAGQTTAVLSPDSILAVANGLARNISETPEHGTPKQQLEAFVLGAHGKDCTEQGMLKIVTNFPAPTPTN